MGTTITRKRDNRGNITFIRRENGKVVAETTIPRRAQLNRRKLSLKSYLGTHASRQAIEAQTTINQARNMAEKARLISENAKKIKKAQELAVLSKNTAVANQIYLQRVQNAQVIESYNKIVPKLNELAEKQQERKIQEVVQQLRKKLEKQQIKPDTTTNKEPRYPEGSSYIGRPIAEMIGRERYYNSYLGKVREGALKLLEMPFKELYEIDKALGTVKAQEYLQERQKIIQSYNQKVKNRTKGKTGIYNTLDLVKEKNQQLKDLHEKYIGSNTRLREKPALQMVGGGLMLGASGVPVVQTVPRAAGLGIGSYETVKGIKTHDPERVGAGLITAIPSAYGRPKNIAKIKHVLSKDYPFRADKLVITNLGIQLKSVFPKKTTPYVEIPTDPIQKYIFNYMIKTEGTYGGSRSLDSWGVQLSRYKNKGIQTSDLDILYKDTATANKHSKQLVKELNTKFGKNRFKSTEATGDTLNSQITDTLKKNHYDIVGEKEPFSMIGNVKVLKLSRQSTKKLGALLNPERVYRSYDPIKRVVEKDFTDFVDIGRSKINKNLDPKWFLKKGAKDYTTFNPTTKEFTINTKKLPNKIKTQLSTTDQKAKTISLKRYVAEMQYKNPSANPINYKKLNNYIERYNKYNEKYKYKKYNTDKYKKYKLKDYYPKTRYKPYPTKPYKSYKYQRPYLPYGKYPSYVPPDEERKIPLMTKKKKKNKRKTKIKDKKKQINKIHGYRPVVGQIELRKDMYPTEEQAIAKAMKVVDKTPLVNFRIKKVKKKPRENYTKTYKKYLTPHKFKKVTGGWKELKKYRNDQRNEKGMNKEMFNTLLNKRQW